MNELETQLLRDPTIFPSAEVLKEALGNSVCEIFESMMSTITGAEYGCNTFDVTRIFARPFSTNRASQQVLEKAGFTLEARLPNALFKYGEYMDELIYAIRKEEKWKI